MSGPHEQPPESAVIDELFANTGTEQVPISNFIARMIDRGFTREAAVYRLHRQIDAGNVALDSLFKIVRR